MNGVHDMGGMQGLGPIHPEKNEPVFHARWEARVYALTRAVGAWGKWSIDASRHQRELLPPAEYLRMSYYEKWLAGLTEIMVKSSLVTRAEIASGKPAKGTRKATPPLTADQVMPVIMKGTLYSRNVPATPHFEVGQRVRARNIHPPGHTRLPRYARGKFGTVERDHGVFVFPDSNAHFLGENPQHVYSVRFTARELWASRPPRTIPSISTCGTPTSSRPDLNPRRGLAWIAGGTAPGHRSSPETPRQPAVV